jgi:hypothetical protein
MAELKELQERLSAARATTETARRTVAAAQQRVTALEAQATQLERRFAANDPDSVRRRKALAAELEKAHAELAQAGRTRESALGALDRIYGQVAGDDPRKALSGLDASLPILLFPVRLETRFVAGGAGNQLLVRIYPDDCSIDGFEPELSEAEVKNLRRYWCSVWNAGGDLGRWRAAWRELAAAHGPGRGLYLLQSFQPLAGSDPEPTRVSDAEIILVIPEAAPSAAERPAIEAYWTGSWRTGSDEASFPALASALGAARAAEVRKTLVPYNRLERPLDGVDRATASVSVAFVALRSVAEAATKRQAWTRPPEARLLPERFVLVAESGSERVEQLGSPVRDRLAVGPDPLAVGDEQFSADGANLKVPDALAWMSDFAQAEAAGMGIRINLTERQARFGFDRLYVLGVRLGSTPEATSQELETLISHQFQSQAGFALVAQGAPTNNSEQGSSAWARVQEADELFESVRGLHLGEQRFDPSAAAVFDKRDGLALADALGINPDVLQHVPGAAGTDQAEGHAMNAALWPATLGYFLNTQVRPVFDDRVIEQARRYFIDWVSARGVVPAVRVGRQPYGILPTTAFSRWAYAESDVTRAGAGPFASATPFLRELHQLVQQKLAPFWDRFAAAAPHVGQATSDPQQLLLDILGLHASSVEFHLQVLDSVDRLWNTYRFYARSGVGFEASVTAALQAGRELLRTLGYSDSDPEILQKLFSYVEGPMNRAAVDELPLSETTALRECTPTHQNYLEWCRDRAANAFDDLRALRGFNPGQTPNALLFHLLRHALQLGYHDTAIELHVAAGLIARGNVAQAYREPSFIHVADAAPTLEASESRYRYLYASAPAISGGNATVAEFIPSWLAAAGSSSSLSEQLAAIRVFERAPTARLERCFAEHIDLCSYRLDAWLQSFVNERLGSMRRPTEGQKSRRGLYVGAFGWIEGLKPNGVTLETPQLSPELASVFETEGEPPLRHDPANGGHLLAPSLNHAVTAAVLKNGYLVNATPSNPDAFAVDLSSARVRVAVQFLEGIRNGQPLGALLGYQLERRLHDRHDEAEVDVFIYELRKAFPLSAKKIADSVDAASDSASIESVEARNVCDGWQLLEHVKNSDIKSYPWGKPLQRGSGPQEAIINEEVKALFETEDAIADLLLAESVHQVAAGNPDRGAAALDAGGKGGFPPEPDVVRTPRSGIALTHRIALHLPVNASAPAGATPRAAAEPALDSWLADVLPPLGDLVVRVKARNSTPGASLQTVDVALSALGLSPIDALFVLDLTREQGMTDFEDRVASYVQNSLGLCPDASLELRYTDPVPGKKTVFETAPLLDSLRKLLLGARPLKASDAALPNEASTLPVEESVPATALDGARTALTALIARVTGLLSTVTPLADDVAPFANVIAAADDALTRFSDVQVRAGNLGVSPNGTGKQRQAARDFFALVRKKARAVSAFWSQRILDYDARLAEADDPSAGELAKRDALLKAERAVSATFTPPPYPDFTTLRAAVTGKHDQLLIVKAQIDAVADAAVTDLQPLWQLWAATATPRQVHDITTVSFDDEQAILRRLFQDMLQQLSGLSKQLSARLAKADDLRAQADAASGTSKVELSIECSKALLGDGFRVIPRFTLATEQANEWQNAYAAQSSTLTHLAPDHDFPVDDWLYGVARVRPKLHDLEKVIQIAGAFGRAELELSPIQFPFVNGEPWFGLELPPSFELEKSSEHVLYTALYGPAGFDRTAAVHGGLLLDEWTEVIPAKRETAGLAFHFDRPSNEPPQAWLLVTPASVGPNWQWADLQLAVPETFELAKKRAAEPRSLAASPLARLLPATLMACTASPITISSLLQTADVLLQTPGRTNG